MPPRDGTLRLHDIIEAISRILRYTAHHSLESFAADEMAVDAVVPQPRSDRRSSATRRRHDGAALPDVPWREMRDLRNLLAHEYFGVSTSIIWETVVRDLPPVLERLREDVQP